jgi:hypothetical protein
LIKVGWITFKEALNVSTNPLSNHASGSGSVNALEAEYWGNLKALIVKARCKEGSMNY